MKHVPECCNSETHTKRHQYLSGKILSLRMKQKRNIQIYTFEIDPPNTQKKILLHFN